jgi:hypothetical protein
MSADTKRFHAAAGVVVVAFTSGAVAEAYAPVGRREDGLPPHIDLPEYAESGPVGPSSNIGATGASGPMSPMASESYNISAYITETILRSYRR